MWTVRDLVASVRTHIEREYTDAWVEGEISNFRSPESGHLYFTLKDGDSQIRVVMFRSAARLLRFRPADGLQVTPPADPNLAPPGDYMLFLLNGDGVPSVAHFIRVGPAVGA